MEKNRFKRDMKSTRGVSKHHPNGFRDDILAKHQSRMSEFKSKLNSISELEESFLHSSLRS